MCIRDSELTAANLALEASYAEVREAEKERAAQLISTSEELAQSEAQRVELDAAKV